MINIRLTLLPVVALLGAVLFAACGGDGDKTISTDNGDVNVSDDLPGDFPDSFPIYDGADLQSSITGENQGVQGTVVTWTTGDSSDDVVSFYEDKMNGDEWAIESKGDSPGSGSFIFARNSGESLVAYIFVSEAGGDTSILATVGEDDGTFTGDGADDPTPDDGDSSAGEGDFGGDGSGNGLPEEVDLSGDFPTDRVSLPDGARVTSNSNISSGGTTIHFVEFYSDDSADDIANFFKDGLPGNGWEETLSSESDGQVFLTFSESGADSSSASSVIVSIVPSPVDGYQQVTVNVSVPD